MVKDSTCVHFCGKYELEGCFPLSLFVMAVFYWPVGEFCT